MGKMEARARRAWLRSLSDDALRMVQGSGVDRELRRRCPEKPRGTSCPPRLRAYLAVARPDANPERYYHWRREVLRLAGYQCAHCGRRQVYFHAHHVRAWWADVRHRYDPRNGVCLCRVCHEAEHGRTFPPILVPLPAARVVPVVTTLPAARVVRPQERENLRRE